MDLLTNNSMARSYHHLNSKGAYYNHHNNFQPHQQYPSHFNFYEMSSPKESKDNIEAHPHFNSTHSPQPLPKMQNLPFFQNYQSERYLSIPSTTQPERFISTIPQPNPKFSSPLINQIGKPKIVFRYSGSDNLQKKTSNSCGSKCQENNEKIYIGQFQLSMLKQIKKDNLKICSNELSHSILPRHFTKSVKKASSLSRDKYFRTAQPTKKLFRTSGTGFPIAHEEVKKGKQSKIASTQATRSFQQGEPSETRYSNINKETTFDFSSIKSLEMKPKDNHDKSCPSQHIKNTLTFSKYDFGGVITQEASSSSKEEAFLPAEERQKWKSYVKCLFDEDEDLKQSIHCGPEIRRDNIRLEVLTGFGREIAESCIPETESFQ